MDIRRSLRGLVSVSAGRDGALDGLRGIAILLVLASHASAGRFPLGGMIGVTLFFVLSGYLITGILIREHDKFGGVDFFNFCVKRALRLLPALTVLLVLTPFALWLLRDPRLGWELVSASLTTFFYISDFVRAAGDPLVVLGHTWSLAVEEQFYLIWPTLLVLAALRWLSKAKAFWVVVSLATVLTVWRLAASGMFAFDRSYFSLDTNAFGLIFGVCLALRPIKLSPRNGSILAGLATVGLLGFSMAPVSPSSPAYYAALTFGAPLAGLLGLAAVAGAQNAGRPFDLPPLIFFGRISYALYLWHEVILLSKPGGGEIDGIWRAVAIVASIGLAVASWILVESPIHNRRHRFLRAERRPRGDTPLNLLDIPSR